MTKEYLLDAYSHRKLSMHQIAQENGCSLNKIDYWTRKHGIPRRSRSDANYVYYNPHGDPFTVNKNLSIADERLFGVGIGLYWGERTKASKNAVRLGNSDPKLLLTFMRFLNRIYSVPVTSLRFGLQVFTDCNEQEALDYWRRELGVEISQFYKVHVTISGKVGSYKRKSRYGVVTLHYHNTHLRNILVDQISTMPR